jgi:hypothetical protein
MKSLSRIFLFLICVTAVLAQAPEPPLSDMRLTIHTLVREDIFAGYLSNDLKRLARGEQNIQTLLEKRPDAKAELLSWQAGATLYRAVIAHENNQASEFQQTYRRALDLFAEAQKLGPHNGGVAAVTGGSYLLFADRLPEEHRAAAWAKTYDAYQALWKEQGPAIDRLPIHLRGELLSGLAMSSQRTGRTEEATRHLDKILAVLRDTPYEPAAKQWKANPKAAANNSLACMTCHDAGKLSARLAALNK